MFHLVLLGVDGNHRDRLAGELLASSSDGHHGCSVLRSPVYVPEHGTECQESGGDQ